MAATRLRKTFHYPDSSDDEDTVEAGLDAQDLLTSLQTHDKTSTRTYTLLLLILPLSIALLSLPGLLGPSTCLPSLLAIASCAASAYTLYYLPLPPVRGGLIIEGQSAATRRGGYGMNTHVARPRQERVRIPWVADEVQELLERYIVPGNAVVCGVLAVLEMMRGREWREGMMVGGGYVAGLVLVVVLWARRELRGVDMSELEGMKDRS